MTLLLLGYAAANASLAVGLMLAGAMAFGIAATLGAIGLIAIVSRRRLSGWLGGDSRFEVAVRPLAAVSAAIIACVGTGAFLVELWSRRGPFG
jgi:ABC-type nickel/cobalt efflux system permease component RcnA